MSGHLVPGHDVQKCLLDGFVYLVQRKLQNVECAIRAQISPIFSFPESSLMISRGHFAKRKGLRGLLAVP